MRKKATANRIFPVLVPGVQLVATGIENGKILACSQMCSQRETTFPGGFHETFCRTFCRSFQKLLAKMYEDDGRSFAVALYLDHGFSYEDISFLLRDSRKYMGSRPSGGGGTSNGPAASTVGATIPGNRRRSSERGKRRGRSCVRRGRARGAPAVRGCGSDHDARRAHFPCQTASGWPQIGSVRGNYGSDALPS